ncbi:MAG: hypothetical protein ACI30B_08580 [Paludibacteraceae bacterium]
MLVRKLILLSFVWVGFFCSAQTGVVIESSAKYTFSKNSSLSSAPDNSSWGDEANALNVRSSIFDGQEAVASNEVQMLSGQNGSVAAASGILSVGSTSLSRVVAGSRFSQRLSASGGLSKRNASKTVADVADGGSMSMPFNVIMPKDEYPDNPYDPGDLDPPDAPIGEGCGLLLLSALAYALAKRKR